MRVYKIVGNPDSIRAFVAAQTHAHSGLEVEEKYAMKLIEDVPIYHDYRAEKLVKNLERWDHNSTREFVQFQLHVEEVSRVLSFWLMTYATELSFLQQSQRFVEVDATKAVPELKDYIRPIARAYEKLTELVPEEDARYILPQGVYTNFSMIGNLQGFYLASSELMKRKFHKEIYEFINEVYKIVSKEARTSVDGVLKKLPKGDKKPTNFYYHSNETRADASLENLILDDFLDDEEKLKQSYVKIHGTLSTAGAHQFIRHRAMQKVILSIGNGYIIPPSIKSNEKAKDIFDNVVGVLFDLARENESQYFLPNAAAVEVYGTEDLYHFIGNFLPLRTCYAAQWEIRRFAMKLRNQLEEKIGTTIPIGRCFYYKDESWLSEFFPTRKCPEPKKVRERCGIYLKLKN